MIEPVIIGRAVAAPETKLSILRGHIRAGRWPEAIKLAASFGRLGAEKAAVLQGREALARPDFQRQLGRCPAALIETAKAALLHKYGEK